MLTLAILRARPFIGGWTVFLSVLFGLGALALWMYRNYGHTAATAAA